MENRDGDTSGNGKQGVGRAAGRVRADMRELGEALAQGKADVAARVSDFIQAHPLRALGLAFGTGYLLAGGLFSKTTSRLLAVGLRVSSLALARDFLSGLGEQTDERT